MKKKILGFVSILLLGLSLVGCKRATDDDSSGGSGSEQLYYIEAMETDMSYIQDVVSQSGYTQEKDFTFAEVKEIRQTIRNGECTRYDFSSFPNVTRSDIYDFLVSHGKTPTEANTVIAKLNSRGNEIMFYTLANPTHAAYVYAEKQ